MNDTSDQKHQSKHAMTLISTMQYGATSKATEKFNFYV